MSLHGADVQELRRLSVELATAADELDSEGQLMTRLLNNVSWLGDVATRFIQDWTGQQLPRIGLSTRFLREASERLARHADDQEEASAATSPSPGVPTFRTTSIGEDGTQPPHDLLRTMAHGNGEDGQEPIEGFPTRTITGKVSNPPPEDLPHTATVGEDGTQPPNQP